MPRIRRFLAVLTTLAVIGAWAPADADWTPTPAGWVSGPVEHVATLTHDAGGGSDVVRHGDLLVVSTFRSFSIYDVSDPVAPSRLSTVDLGVAAFNERPQTNGEILLISRDAQYLPPMEETPRGGNVLDIYDIRDPRDPTLITTYASEITGFWSARRDHIWTCVQACDYVYGAGGSILDLRDPAAPVRVGDWTDIAPIDALHWIGEVQPGIVVTGSRPSHVLDVRSPTQPRLLTTFDPSDDPGYLPARAASAAARLAVMTLETPFTGPCTDGSGDVRTFTTAGWQAGGFQLADTYRLDNGAFVDGSPPANAIGCSAYGLDLRPGFGPAGGDAAVTFFEHGVRLLSVDVDGQISELGGFLPHGGESASVEWVTDDVLYVIDMVRGIDILRVAN